MTPPFTPGQPVARAAFTDCFNKPHERVNGLTVESVRLVECQSMPSYWRIVAVRKPTLAYSGGCAVYLAAARMFEVALSPN